LSDTLDGGFWIVAFLVGDRGVEGDGDFGEGERNLEAVPGVEGFGAVVMDLNRDEGGTCDLGEFEGAGLDLVAGATRAVGSDDEVRAVFGCFF